MEILVITAVVLFATGQSLFCRMYTSAQNGRGAVQFSVLYAFLAGVCTLAIGGFRYAPSGTTLLLGALNAVMLLTYNIAMVHAGNLGSFAFLMIGVLSGGILVPMAYDLLFLGTRLNAWQIAAVAMMLVSFVMMNRDGLSGKKSGAYLAWVGVLFLVNGLYGTLMGLQQNAMEFTQRSEMIVTTYLGTAVIGTLFSLVRERGEFFRGFRMSGRAAAFLGASALCCTGSVNLLLYAMKLVRLTVLNVTVNGGVLVISAGLAYFVFREKMTAWKIAGIGLAAVSVILLSI
ncbi:MAG: hypothetical protein SOW23_07340 [Eubacteriales bacterium]|nr:hypothetical protein [Eubacteriales bacterium]MDY2601592.1 hypothetical protein [Eubacteriales bacterium]